MAKLNISKWQAARRERVYSPVMQFYLRMIRTAFDEARAIAGVECPYLAGVDGAAAFGFGNQVESWDSAIMARDWIARATPNRHADTEGYLVSFEHACEVLGLNADHEATWMLREIDVCADFDTDEVHARVAYLTINPPDLNEESLFEPIRVVPILDQGCLFGMMEVA